MTQDCKQRVVNPFHSEVSFCALSTLVEYYITFAKNIDLAHGLSSNKLFAQPLVQLLCSGTNAFETQTENLFLSILKQTNIYVLELNM